MRLTGPRVGPFSLNLRTGIEGRSGVNTFEVIRPRMRHVAFHGLRLIRMRNSTITIAPEVGSEEIFMPDHVLHINFT